MDFMPPSALLRISILSIYLLLPQANAWSQTVADIRPMLKGLRDDQQQQLIRYLRHINAPLDEGVQNAYRQLPERRKKQVVDLLEYYRTPNRENLLTTVSWLPDTLHLGDMADRIVHVDSFRVTNTGQYPYLIERARATCDCVIYQTPDYPIMPGESATLRVEFNSREKIGHSRPVVVVYDNSFPNRRQILHIKAHILPRKTARMPWDN
ncbi:MAG: DUF1573 domain-containing protein [Saprospiraceae bacterium]|nr:DUF1573 domain-containing protein [Saprospiraceae bacterium]